MFIELALTPVTATNGAGVSFIGHHTGFLCLSFATLAWGGMYANETGESSILPRKVVAKVSARHGRRATRRSVGGKRHRGTAYS